MVRHKGNFSVVQEGKRWGKSVTMCANVTESLHDKKMNKKITRKTALGVHLESFFMSERAATLRLDVKRGEVWRASPPKCDPLDERAARAKILAFFLRQTNAFPTQKSKNHFGAPVSAMRRGSRLRNSDSGCQFPLAVFHSKRRGQRASAQPSP